MDAALLSWPLAALGELGWAGWGGGGAGAAGGGMLVLPAALLPSTSGAMCGEGPAPLAAPGEPLRGEGTLLLALGCAEES